MTVSVLTDCGLSYPRIWLEDEPHRFDVPATEINAPMGWSGPTQDITIKREGDQWVAYSPWFSRFVLVPDPGAELGGCP